MKAIAGAIHRPPPRILDYTLTTSYADRERSPTIRDSVCPMPRPFSLRPPSPFLASPGAPATTTDHRDSPWRRGRCHALWQHQSSQCFHCGSSMPDPLPQRERHRKRPDAATIDHVLPRTLGGMESWLNEVAACRACNATKADRMPSAIELWRLAWLKQGELLAYAGQSAEVLRRLVKEDYRHPPSD